MILEIARLVLALFILCFHKQIADFILEHERRLVATLNQRGLRLPDVPSRELCRDLYFSIGAIASLGCVVRLWMTAHLG
jgi:hypothetical protein